MLSTGPGPSFGYAELPANTEGEVGTGVAESDMTAAYPPRRAAAAEADATRYDRPPGSRVGLP